MRAVVGYWSDPNNNPVSSVYDGPMVDMSKAQVWSWDTRPFPAFPSRSDIWTDAANYARGHWLNGRSSHETLAAVIADICHRAGVSGADVSRTYGLVRGYEADMSSGGRGALQPLLLGYGVNAAEREGKLTFTMRTGRSDAEVKPEELTRHSDLSSEIERVRAPGAENPGRVRLGYIRGLSEFETATTDAAFPGDEARTPATSELALVLSANEARATAERWLAEGRVARDTVRFSLPPSALELGAGDVVSVAQEGLFRIDRVEMGQGQLLEAVRVEPGAYVAPEEVEEDVPVRPVDPPAVVTPVFLDIPQLSESDAPQAPYLAVASTPWPGPVAVYDAVGDAGYVLNTVIEAPASFGLTLDPLPAADAGRWDRGAPLRVQLFSGGPLSAVERAPLLAGANAFAIGDGVSWEVFQAQDVTLVAPDVYALSMRLRGQLGTDATQPEAWPVGAQIVLLDPTVQQIDLPLAARGVARNYRIGPVTLPVSDPALRHMERAFDGVGLRPFAPVHLRARARSDGGCDVRWIRRTRLGGDSWFGEDVPLAEEAELYRLRILDGAGDIIRQTDVASTLWTWSAADRASDVGAAAIEVAQVSQAYGAGPYRRIEIDE
ncbi:MAG: phage tail protein [Pseudomonadota bacterium]